MFNIVNNYISQAKEVATKVLTDLDEGGSHDEGDSEVTGPLQKLKDDASTASQLITNAASMLGDNEPFLSLVQLFVRQNLPALNGDQESLFFEWVSVYDDFKKEPTADLMNRLQVLAKKIGEILETDPTLQNWYEELQTLRVRNAQLSNEIAALNNQQWGSFDAQINKSSESLYAPSNQSSICVPLTSEMVPMLSSGSEQFEAINLDDGADASDQEKSRIEKTLAMKISQLESVISANDDLNAQINKLIKEKEKIMLDAQETEASSIKVITELRTTVDTLRADHEVLKNKHTKLSELYEKTLRSGNDELDHDQVNRINELVELHQADLLQIKGLTEQLNEAKNASDSNGQLELSLAVTKLTKNVESVEHCIHMSVILQTVDKLLLEIQETEKNNVVHHHEAMENQRLLNDMTSDVERWQQHVAESDASNDVITQTANEIRTIKQQVISYNEGLFKTTGVFKDTLHNIYKELSSFACDKVDYLKTIEVLVSQQIPMKSQILAKLQAASPGYCEAADQLMKLFDKAANLTDASKTRVSPKVDVQHNEFLKELIGFSHHDAQASAQKFTELLDTFNNLQTELSTSQKNNSDLQGSKAELVSKLNSLIVESIETKMTQMKKLVGPVCETLNEQDGVYASVLKVTADLRADMDRSSHFLNSSVKGDKDAITFIRDFINVLILQTAAETRAQMYADIVLPTLGQSFQALQDIRFGIDPMISVYKSLGIPTEDSLEKVQAEAFDLFQVYIDLYEKCYAKYQMYTHNHCENSSIRDEILNFMGSLSHFIPPLPNADNVKFAEALGKIKQYEREKIESIESITQLESELGQLHSMLANPTSAHEHPRLREYFKEHFPTENQIQEQLDETTVELNEREDELRRLKHAYAAVEEKLYTAQRREENPNAIRPDNEPVFPLDTEKTDKMRVDLQINEMEGTIRDLTKKVAKHETALKEKNEMITRLKLEGGANQSILDEKDDAIVELGDEITEFRKSLDAKDNLIHELQAKMNELKDFDEIQQKVAQQQEIIKEKELEILALKAANTDLESMLACGNDTRKSQDINSALWLKQAQDAAALSLSQIKKKNDEIMVSNQENTTLRRTVEKLEKDLEQARGELTIQADQLSTMHIEIDAKDLEISVMGGDLAEAEDRLHYKIEEVRRLKNHHDVLKKELQNKDSELNQIIFERDTVVQKLNFNGGSSDELKKVVSSQSRDIASLQQQRNELLLKSNQLTENNTALTSENTSKTEEVDNLKLIVSELKQEIERLNAELIVPEGIPRGDQNMSQELNHELQTLRQQFVMIRESFSKLILDGKRQSDHFKLIISLLDYDTKVREILQNFIHARDAGAFEWFYDRFSFRNMAHLADQLVTYVEQENAKNNVVLTPPTQPEPAVHLSLEPENVESNSELDGLKDIL